MNLVPLGDQGWLLYLEDEAAAFRVARQVRQTRPAWLIDVVQAYGSVAVFYDLEQAASEAVATEIEQLLKSGTESSCDHPTRLHSIPCCYEYNLDLERVAGHCGLSCSEVIRLHSETVYTVYAIGFCPGFPYLGYLPPELAGVPRLAQPRMRIVPGSVGLTGRQTGIYTQERPGGWHIIGRTPLALVSVADGYFPLRTGDQVRFEPIDRTEFHRLEGRRLATSFG